MSHTLPTSGQYSHFRSIFDAASKAYTEKTGKDLTSHSLLAKLTTCGSADAITTVLRQQIPAFSQPANSDDRLTKTLAPIIKVLNSFSATIGAGIGLAYPPAGVIFTGIGVLLTAAQAVVDGQGALVELFERIGNFLNRLETYTDVPPTAAMTEITVKVMVEVLSILAVATREIERGKAKTFLDKLVGRTDVADALLRLDKLTQEEVRMVAAQNLKATHGLDDKVTALGSEVQGICDKVCGVDDKLEGVEDRVKGVERKVNRVLNVIQQTANDSGGQDWNPTREDVKEWLSPPDPSINYDTALEAHQEGTATWFTEGHMFAAWKESGSLLWIHGKPGSGKSVLSSAIIQDINSISNTGSAYIAYFFFDFKDTGKQDARSLLSSLLIQLSDQSDSHLNKLLALCKAHRNGFELQKPANGALKECLKEMLTMPGQVPIYIVMDALDECPDFGIRSSRGKVLDFVEELVKLHLPNLRLCVTSRPEQDIRTALEPLTSVRICLHDESGQKQDIIDYVRSVVYSDRKMKIWREEDRKLVITTLSDRAGGMFRWVYCQLEILCHSPVRNLRRTLDELPKTLDDTYQRILREIPEQNRDDAYRLLQCLTMAVRPLRVDELAEVLAVDFTAGGMPTLNVDQRWGDQGQAIVLACSSLIAVVEDHDSRVVQFSHFSVKEFLTSDRFAISKGDVSHYYISPEPAHTVMAQACLAVLLRLDYDTDMESIKKVPLARYAALHFDDHARFGNVISHIRNGVDYLLDPEKPHFAAWLWAHDMDNSWMWMEKHPKRLEAVPIFYVAEFGFLGMARHLILKRPQDVNANGGRYATPLHTASYRGHVELSQLLLESGANVRARNEEGKTPLHLASSRGHRDIMRLLLDRGADVDAQDKSCSTPLREALSNWMPEAAQLLLECGANVRARNKEGETLLHLASRRGYRDVMRLSLDRGADVDAKDKSCSTPLHQALSNRKPESAQLLLECGANVRARNKEGETPLHLASRRGYRDIMRLLLDRGADVDAQDKRYWTPLHRASLYEELEAAQLLLERGTNVRTRNKEGETPLHLASKCGYRDIMRLLLDRGADVDAQDKSYRTPLHQALFYQEPEAAQLLLKRGTNVRTRNKEGETPLHLTSRRGYRDIMRLLLDRGADVDAQDKSYWTPLHLALYNGNPEAARLLLERGANVCAQNKEGETPLHLASSCGYRDIMRLLLDRGADVDAQDRSGSTLLHVVSRSGDRETAQLLLECGANVRARNKEGETPPHLASSGRGHRDIIRLLLDRGADVDAQDRSGLTLLHVASRSGERETAQLLLECGANVRARNQEGETPLHLASRDGSRDIMRLLLDRGADVDAQDKNCKTPLHVASRCQTPGAAQLLLECGANVRARNYRGKTPLHFASEIGRCDIIRLLLDRGVELDVQDKYHFTPLHEALRHGELEATQLLLRHGANVRARTVFGTTPLWHYHWHARKQRMKRLLSDHMRSNEQRSE